MKTKFIIVFIFLLNINAYSQTFDCATPPMAMGGPNNCNDFNEYGSYSYVPQNTPIKYVRISLHVFNKTNGTGNLPNNTTSRNWLTNTVLAGMNNTMANLLPMHLASTPPSNYYQDSRIRYVLDNIYFWNDDNGWNTDINRPDYFSLGAQLYNTYVTNQITVTNKTTSIHIFLGGQIYDKGYSTGSFSNNQYIVASGAYSRYLAGDYWMTSNLLNHELGHNLGLNHTWTGDECDDTPNNSNCWNAPTCSSNMMDYNAQQASLTQCQINRMHYFLMDGGSGVSNCLIGSISPESSQITGSSIICNSINTFSLTGLQFGVTTYWTASPSSNVQISKTCGLSTNISTINSTPNAISLLNCEMYYGKYGSVNPTKVLSLNKLTNVVTLCGNMTGASSGLTIQTGTSCGSIFNIGATQNATIIGSSLIELSHPFEISSGGAIELNISPNCP